MGKNLVRVRRTEIERIGSALRDARRRQGMSLRGLAKLAQISGSYLSEIERGIALPTLPVLKKITDALRIPLSVLVDGSGAQTPVLRRDQRCSITFAVAGGSVRYEYLAPDIPRRMEPLLGVLSPGASTAATGYSHRGEEWGLVLEGELTVELEDESMILGEGDSIYFASSRQHRLVNNGQKVCKYIWVSLPPVRVSQA